VAHKAAVAVSEAAEHVAERQSRASFVARQVQAVALGRAEARWEEQRRAHGWSRCAGVTVCGEARGSWCAGRRGGCGARGGAAVAVRGGRGAQGGARVAVRGCRGARGGARLAVVRSRCAGRREAGGCAVGAEAVRPSVGGESGT